MAVLGNTKITNLTLLDGVIGDLNPVTTKVYNLGTSSLLWNNIYAQKIYADGSNLTNLNATEIKTGTLDAARLATSGVTAGNYGPSANASPGSAGTFSVPYITVDAKGRITSASTKTITMPTSNNYSLPTATSTTLGGVKVGYTTNGKNYKVDISDGNLYVNVPWTDHYAWSDITGKPTSFTPMSHTHGNLSNDGKITTAITLDQNDYIIIGDSSESGKIGKGPIFDGSTATKALTQKGTWETFNNYAHPTGDGNKHVPANGTGNNGKFLKATSTAGTYEWSSLPVATASAQGIMQVGTGLSVNSGTVSVSSSSGSSALSWGTEVTLATVGGMAIKAKLPSNPNTDTDTKQNVTLNTTSKAYITGVITTPTATAQALVGIADTSIYLDTTPGRLTAAEFNATRPMVISAGKNYSNGTGNNVILPSKTSMLYGDGLAISNPTTSNDVGWLRVLGTGESDTVFEIATGDDGAAGESIVARQYNTANNITHSMTLLDKTTGDTIVEKMIVNDTAPTVAFNISNAEKAHIVYNSTDESIDFVFA